MLSNWTRHTTTAAVVVAVPGNSTTLLSLRVQIPSGIRSATVHVPLLGRKATEVQLELRSNANTPTQKEMVTLWQAGVSRSNLVAAGIGVGSCRSVRAANGDEVLELVVGAGIFEFGVSASL